MQVLCEPAAAVSQSRDRLAERIHFVRQKVEAATASVQADLGGPSALGGLDLESFGGGAASAAAAVGSGGSSGRPAGDLQAATKSM